MTKKELLEKIKKAHSCDELMALANENGIKLERSKAEEIFARLNKSCEISDDKLASVSGGAGFDDEMHSGIDGGEIQDQWIIDLLREIDARGY